jgi:hypothetical protein
MSNIDFDHKVSVIMAAYNAADYLCQAIDSILIQVIPILNLSLWMMAQRTIQLKFSAPIKILFS